MLVRQARRRRRGRQAAAPHHRPPKAAEHQPTRLSTAERQRAAQARAAAANRRRRPRQFQLLKETMSETKKPTDIFSAGRSIYLRRKSLREKADKLLDEAPAAVRAIVESIEEEEGT